MSLIQLNEDPTDLCFEPGTVLTCNSCRRQFTVGPEGHPAEYVHMDGKEANRMATRCPVPHCGGALYLPIMEVSEKVPAPPPLPLSIIIGVPFVLMGAIMVWRLAPLLALEALSPGFLELWSVTVVPPQYWKLATEIFGAVLIVAGATLIVAPRLLPQRTPDAATN